MLTPKQHKLLEFIDRHLQSNGISPSFEEMMHAIELKSKSGVHRLIIALEERGFLRRLPNRARALEIMRRPPNPDTKKKSGGINLGKLFQVPLLGKIAAGNPIEAITQAHNFIDVPPLLVAQGKQHYALIVEGDSMINEGIYDGDVAVIEFTQDANDGQIVVAMVDEGDVTLKTLRRKKSGVVQLIPANNNHRVQEYPGDRVRIQGVLRGLLRKY
jgi:repressor LexA